LMTGGAADSQALAAEGEAQSDSREEIRASTPGRRARGAEGLLSQPGNVQGGITGVKSKEAAGVGVFILLEPSDSKSTSDSLWPGDSFCQQSR